MGGFRCQKELRRSGLAPLFRFCCRWRRLGNLLLKYIRHAEGGDFYSSTLREFLRESHGVDVGAYSYGACLAPGVFPSSVSVGRYVSVASGVQVLLRNHPLDRLSLHPFFYNARLGFVREDTISATTLEIGHDAWIGSRAIITVGCERIGIGAVVGAGAVVTKNVPDFAIVAGNPAKLIRYRFDEATRAAILASRWWELPVEECVRHMEFMTKPLPECFSQHPLLQERTRPELSGQ